MARRSQPARYVARRRSFRLPSRRRPIRSVLGQGDAYSGHRDGAVSTGSGQERAATLSAVLGNPVYGHRPLGVQPVPAPQQSVISPAKKIRPDRCGAATLSLEPQNHQSRRISRQRTAVPLAVPSNEQLRWPVSSGMASPSERVTAPGARDAPAGAATWATLCWEPGPRGRWAVPGAQGRTHPPIDLGRNANGVAGVTRLQTGERPPAVVATEGVGTP
jgi:hypothetical protein